MPLAFNAVKLYVVTINGKPWARAREVCRALEYGKATKVANIAKHLSNRENYAHKCQFNEFALVFSSQQSKTKDLRRHCCNVLFPHVQQQLTNKMKEDHKQAIEEKDNQIQAHQQKI